MQTRNRNTFTTIHTEGALLPVDLLQRIGENDKGLDGLTPESYHLAPGEKINEAINRSWNRLSGLWGGFKTSRGRLGPGEAGTTLTRERWLLPLFQELGFGRLTTAKAVEIEGKSYPISHRWENVPLHLVGCGLELDKRTPGAAGAARISPHSLMQEYLNRDDAAQWGLLSNGLGLRVLRDNATLTRQAYLEFDLESMFEGEVYSDFVLLWLVCHQSRFETADKQTECLLERWSKNAQELGTRALDDLRSGVEKAITSLGQGFLKHPLNQALRAALKQGQLSAQDYYRQLLRLVYRLIFLFTAEDRDLLLLPGAPLEAKDRYTRYYSTARLRELAQRQRGSRHHDRYEALRLVMRLLDSDQGCPELALPALGGLLFDERFTADLNQAALDNQSLLAAVRSLAFIEDGQTNRAVDFRNLGSEELGSVYEALLELHPQLNIDAGVFELKTAAGNERKTTGSYYTPSSLIRVLLDSALEPVIEKAISRQPSAISQKEGAADAESRLLALKVCDPACGSGHFLIAAAHRIAGRLAQARAGGDEPPPNEVRRALRDVIRHCIYGVDVNPMAVELCKVNLWLESIEPGKPLSFLDAHIKCGNSLVGVGPGVDVEGLEVPDEAFNPVTGDDKATAGLLKKRNKSERAGQESLFVTVLKSKEDLDRWLAEQARAVEAMPEESAAEVEAKAEAYRQVGASEAYRRQRQAADLWTAAFFWQIEKPKSTAYEIPAPTQGQLRRLRGGQDVQAGLMEQVEALSESQGFFHWPLEFADVAAQGGFDCVLGNPPWEMFQLDPREFFATKHPEINQTNNMAERDILIEKIKKNDKGLYEKFTTEKHLIDAGQKFIHFSGRFPLTSSHRINLMALFAELNKKLLSIRGHLGIIVPTAIATDSFNQDFIRDIMQQENLECLYDFENRHAIFPGVHRAYKFCLLVISQAQTQEVKFVFYALTINDLKDKVRLFSVKPNELLTLNPNTATVPVFRTKSDADLTLKIYSHVPILHCDGRDNEWSFKSQLMFMMNTDSHLFLKEWKNGYVRLFEGKMVQLYDHRAASVVTKSENLKRPGQPIDTTLSEHVNPNFTVTPQYYIPEEEVLKRVPSHWKKKWLIVWKKVTSTTNERTMISTVVPLSGISDSLYVAVPHQTNSKMLICLYGNFSSLVLDYVARQKLGGINLSLYHVEQLPILPPSGYSLNNFEFIVSRGLELIYTAYDLQPFAQDILDEIGVDTWNEWFPHSPLTTHQTPSPFQWDEDRRALLRAELDAYYARLYGLNRKQLRYILDPADLTERELEDILDPWEEVADPLGAAGYDARRATSDFPGETFRVLKDKEFRQHGEYRTRRLVLEAWERLEASGEWQAASGEKEARAERPPASAATPPAPAAEVKAQAVVEPVKEESRPAAESQPMLSDFGLYKCESCGKMVMGYEKENHLREKHGGRGVEWNRLR